MTRATTLFLRAATIFTGLGLLAGLYYRALTHITDHPGGTPLSTTHTHLLALRSPLTADAVTLGSESVSEAP